MIKRLFIYGMVGWGLEVLWTGFLSALAGDWRLTSTTYLWMFPIYGMAVLLEDFHDGIRRWPWWARGTFWVVAIWFIEMSSGMLIKALTGTIPWDYTGSTPWQVGWFIRLDMAPLWFVVGLLFERLHDFLIRKLRIY
ncbi:putative ABC transporter permease [Desulfotomaculum nigrificans]|uniref:putative ABC transporter permease n=1 Tax=Desulfotomaculum nigrificans TaxID=1565 RepID=UPI0001FAF0F5|nr:membrane protein [Desulfotomaculum nigrificans]